MVDHVILEKLRHWFGQENVYPEWDVAKNSQDAYTRELYCPRIDFAVGPFNIDANLGPNNDQIRRVYHRHKDFFNELRNHAVSSYRFKTNKNPRCFLAIEVESSGSRKQRIGSIVNASAIGKVGILLAEDQKNYEILTKAKKYLDFIKLAGKTDSSPKNIIILRRDDFINII